jgi:hypothetical protein
MAKMNKQQLRAMLDASNATEGRLRGVIGMLNIKLTELENETRLVVDTANAEVLTLRTKLVASINKANAATATNILHGTKSADGSTSALRLMAQIQMTDTALHIATKEVRRLEAELATSTLAMQTVTGELRDLKNDSMIRCEQLIAKRPRWWPL